MSRSAGWLACVLSLIVGGGACGDAAGGGKKPDDGAPTDRTDAGDDKPDPMRDDAGRPMPGKDAGTDALPMVDASTPDAGMATPDAGPPAPKAAWTVLVYMAADNNLEPFAIDDLNEMLKAKISDDVNVIVELDRASGYYELGVGGLADWKTAKRFQVKQNQLKELQDLGELNTGDPKTLTDFISWGLATYPAERRFVVLWNHGNAWQGYGGDDDAGHDRLSQEEIEGALKDGLAQSKVANVDLVGFDACLMSTFVMANAMRANTRYFIASEELEPGHGWDYTAFLDHLSAHPKTDAVDLGTTIVNTFFEHARKNKTFNKVTLNLLDLDELPGVRTEFDQLARELAAQSNAQKTNIAASRTTVANYGYHVDPASDFHMVDLGDFMRKLADKEASFAPRRDSLLASLSKLVIASKYGRMKADSSGLSVYFPTEAGYYKNGYDAVQEGLPWRDFLKGFYELAKTAGDPPSFKGQKVSQTTTVSSRPRLPQAPGLPARDTPTDDPVAATSTCNPEVGPELSSAVAPADIARVATARLIAGLVDERTRDVHVFAQEPAEVDGTGQARGNWDRHVVVANQGALQQLLFAEVKLDTEDLRFVHVDIPVLYSEPPACACAIPGAPGYSDADFDQMPDCADPDVDNDSVADKGKGKLDNCPWVPNLTQADTDADGIGDACESASRAPTLACTPAPTGDFGNLESAFWQVTVDILNDESFSATLYVQGTSGVSEIALLPGALLWPRGVYLNAANEIEFRTGAPLSFNLQQPIDFHYLDVEQIFVRNEAGATLLNDNLEPTRLIDKLGWGEVYMRVFLSDFAGNGGAAETSGDFSNCDPPEVEFCTAPQLPDCDGRCIVPTALQGNGRCDDGAGGTPNLNCELRNFDDGECERPDCPANYVRDCEGQCTLKADVLGDSQCDALASCAALNWDNGDCPCGPDCSGNGTCGTTGCACNPGYGGTYCEVPPSCGDGTCSAAAGESCKSCAADCGACPVACGDGVCRAGDGESCSTCAADCGVCACGDGVCGGDETCSTCAGDCGECPVCGDFQCQKWTEDSPFAKAQGESCATCAVDCGTCEGDCCTASETGDTRVGGGCGNQTVAQCVCALDSGCCDLGWSATCVALAKNNCGLTCETCSATVGGDADQDGTCGASDNCPVAPNPGQADSDADGFGDACDVCASGDDLVDPDQDGKASACDNCPAANNVAQADGDADGLGNSCDNCASVANPEQEDVDDDRVGNACDNCANASNADQRDADADGLGDACDSCNDGIVSPDTDGDGFQDTCDNDDDNDSVLDGADNCALVANVAQQNTDGDAQGDACDPDDDNDGTLDAVDNCPLLANADQQDVDGDGLGDACDGDADGDGVPTVNDSNDLNPIACRDDDTDGCDDCASGTYDMSRDGLDTDADGLCNAGDSDADGDGVPTASDGDDLNGNVCRDDDVDSCDDCTSGAFNPANDGLDSDNDGLCDAGDDDDDNDRVLSANDSDDLNPNVCRDDDADTCNDCASGTYNPANDGADLDADGLCDVGDADVDGDSVLTVDDSNDRNPFACRDDDVDTCDDCASGNYNPANDGPDLDADGICNLGDGDADGDGVTVPSDSNDFSPSVCSDVDVDSCDDCTIGSFNPGSDGPDFDGDGVCDAGDACPNDPTKRLSGACGCGVSDLDTDGDGSADCVDACPTDPARTIAPCSNLPVTTGLAAHYDAQNAASIVRDQDNFVYQWNDLSGLGRNLTVNAGPPVYDPIALIDFPGIFFAPGSGMISTAFELTSELTVFAVVRHGTPEPWGAIAHHGSRDFDWSLENNSFAGAGTVHFQSNNDNEGARLSVNAGTDYILAGRITGTTRYASATSDVGFNITSGANVSIAPGSKVLYVGRSDAGETYNGHISELVYYDRALSDPERDAVLAYLQSRWDIIPPIVAAGTSCANVLASNPGAASGQYYIDPDGVGPNPPFLASCDMDADGGGWTLVLNYSHAGGTSPLTSVRTTDLPLLLNTTLGDDESGIPSAWGHASNAMFSSLAPTQIRFYGVTSGHARVIDFYTVSPSCLSYFSSGTGGCAINNNFVPLALHSSNLPLSQDAGDSNQGGAAMTSQPVYRAFQHHWNIGASDRWEVDDFGPANGNHTIHRIWVR